MPKKESAVAQLKSAMATLATIGQDFCGHADASKNLNPRVVARLIQVKEHVWKALKALD